MIKEHKLDAPEALENEHLSSANEYDRSDLNNLYPEIPVDERPLLMSDDERHQLHDRELQQQIAKIRQSFVWIGFQLVLPVILVLYLLTFYLAYAMDDKVKMMLLPALLIGGMITVGVWYAAYRAIVKRFSLHNLSGAAYIVTTLIVLGVFTIPIYSLADFSGNPWITTTGLVIGLTLVSIITTFLTLQLATRRRSRRD